jgi:LacI family transcriptional regulator
MKRILFLSPGFSPTWPRIIEGAYDFSRTRDWMFLIQDQRDSLAEMRKLLKDWQPDGCIVDCGHGYGYHTQAFSGLPTVYLNMPRGKTAARHSVVREDTKAIMDTALDYLLNLNREHYAFVGVPVKAVWNELRLAMFKQRMKAEGKPYTILSYADAAKPQTITRLPQKCGILGCNDKMAQIVLQSARIAGREIPDDISVVGIDNEVLVCEAQSPGITSVEIDLHLAGYKLGELLERLMDDPKASPQTATYGPSYINYRGSSRILQHPTAKIQSVLDFIQTNAYSGNLRIEDVAKMMGCSRTLAINRFKQATGKSILQAINDIRFERACQLLKNSNLTIYEIVTACGYDSESFFKKLFRARTGMTMREYRNSNAMHSSRPTP